MSAEYTVDYFIEKFEAIPDEKWCTGVFEDMTGACCALGHCGYRGYNVTDESRSLSRLFGRYHQVGCINDGDELGDGEIVEKYGYTPKERILNALREIKSKDAGEQS